MVEPKGVVGSQTWLTKIEVSNVVNPSQTFLFLPHFVHFPGLERTKQGERKEVEGQMEEEVASDCAPCCLGLCADWKPR